MFRTLSVTEVWFLRQLQVYRAWNTNTTKSKSTFVWWGPVVKTCIEAQTVYVKTWNSIILFTGILLLVKKTLIHVKTNFHAIHFALFNLTIMNLAYYKAHSMNLTTRKYVDSTAQSFVSSLQTCGINVTLQ